MTKKELLDRCARDGAERILLARVLDKLELSQTRGVPAHTPFLSPGEQAWARRASICSWEPSIQPILSGWVILAISSIQARTALLLVRAMVGFLLYLNFSESQRFLTTMILKSFGKCKGVGKKTTEK